jgi:hypothetical protein
MLGEITHTDGRLRDVHLKGSGRTPFGRGGDGLAVVGPMLREYLVSEAMHALGVPTTRSLAVSFIGHTLGFWPHESLVCITLDANRVGATLRVDLPTREGGLRYARTVADYLAHDTSAASVLFAVYTSAPRKPGQPKPHTATIAALTCALAERGMSIRDGLLVGDNTVSQYDGDPQDGLTSRSRRPSRARSTPNSSTAAAPSHRPTTSPCQPRPKKAQRTPSTTA